MGKKIKDAEFSGWKAMNELDGRPGVWIYMNPGNTEVAMVYTVTGDVLWISSKNAKVVLYQNPDVKHLAHTIMGKSKSII